MVVRHEVHIECLEIEPKNTLTEIERISNKCGWRTLQIHFDRQRRMRFERVWIRSLGVFILRRRKRNFHEKDNSFLPSLYTWEIIGHACRWHNLIEIILNPKNGAQMVIQFYNVLCIYKVYPNIPCLWQQYLFLKEFQQMTQNYYFLFFISSYFF